MAVESQPADSNLAIDRLVLHAKNPRSNDAVVDRMCSSIREFGFKIPVLARSDGVRKLAPNRDLGNLLRPEVDHCRGALEQFSLGRA
jgi:hypothetical protein